MVSATYHRRMWSPLAASDAPAESAPTAAAEAEVGAHTILHQVAPTAGAARTGGFGSNHASARVEQAAAVTDTAGASRAAPLTARERDSPEVCAAPLTASTLRSSVFAHLPIHRAACCMCHVLPACSTSPAPPSTPGLNASPHTAPQS